MSFELESKVMSRFDYYKILGLRKGASLQEVKSSFRRLALRYHPDRSPGDPRCEERFRLVAEAYHVLADEHRRRLYDREGHQGLKQRGYKGFEETEEVFRSFAAELLGLLGIGGWRRHTGPLPGADLRYELELSFEEAALGATKTLQITRMELCPACGGDGRRPGVGRRFDPGCSGAAEWMGESSIFSALAMDPMAEGYGALSLAACRVCRGLGRRQSRRRLRLNIPPGVEHRSRLKVCGEGDAGQPGAQRGDLYLLLRVRSHPLFTRAGLHIVCQVTIPAAKARAGGPFKVPTLRGWRTLELPPGVRSGSQFCLSDEGIVNPETSERGAQIIQVYVDR